MNDCYELSDARLMQENGVIANIEIVIEESNLYMIIFLGKNGKQFHLKTQRGSIRYFKTLDSALNTIQSLGYDVSKLVVMKKGE